MNNPGAVSNPDSSQTQRSELNRAGSARTSGLGRRVAIGALWSQIGFVTQVGLLFGFNVLLTRALTPADKGTFDVYTALMGVTVLVAQLGLNFALVRFAPETNQPVDRARRRALIWWVLRDRLIVCAVIGAVIALWHVQIAGWLAAPLFEQAWPFFVIALTGNLTLDTALAATQAGLRMKAHYLLQAGRVTINILFVVAAFAWQGADPFIVVVGMAFAVTVTAIVGLIYALRVNLATEAPPPSAMPSARTLYGYALSGWLIGLTAFGLANQSDVLLINLLIGDTQQVAYYNAAYMLFTQIISIVSGWTTVIMPGLTAAWETRREEGVQRAWLPLAKLQIMGLIPASIFLARLGPLVTRALYGTAYEPSGALLTGFSLLYGLGIIATTVPYHILFVAGHARKLLLARVSTGLINIALNIILLPRVGVWGAVLATSIAIGLTYWFEFALAKRYFNIEYPVIFTVKLMVAAILSAASSLWITVDMNESVLFYTAKGLLAGTQMALALYIALRILKPLNQADIDLVGTVWRGAQRWLKPLAQH
ncbi:MAG: lipopolysaccharide biosynthesis protein [Anaerolineae bacterium]